MTAFRRKRRCFSALAVLFFFSAAEAFADTDEFTGLNDFGGVGLLQTPTARFADEGTFGVGFSRVEPYNQAQVFLTILPWLETTLRYTDITNRLYSTDPNFSGDQTYKDRSFGIKLRLAKESEYLPAIALGFLDVGGTGIFSGEYLVLNRRYYDLDFSLGLGWGRLGAGGSIRNPLAAIADHFDVDRRTTDISDSTPGAGGFSRLFTGKTVGLFGGIQWNTPIRGLSLKVEYDGNDYQSEGLGNRFDQVTPINIGADYEIINGVSLGAGYERGNTMMLRIALRTNFENRAAPAKTNDPLPSAIHIREADPRKPEKIEAGSGAAALHPAEGNLAEAGSQDKTSVQNRAAVVASTKKALAAQTITLLAMDFDEIHHQVLVWIEQNRYRSTPKVVGRTARVLTATVPDRFDLLTVIGTSSGAEIYRETVLRKDLEAYAENRIASEEILHNTLVAPPRGGAPEAQFTGLVSRPKFSWDMGPAFRQQIGGPDGFYFGQIYWKLGAGLQVTDHWSFSALGGFNIVNNFGDIRNTSNSILPHVRSDVVKYLQKGENGLIRLETNYIWSPASQWYARLSGGIFEEMFGGFAAETLYRPFRQRWAVGLDVNYVKQRDFNQQFDFRSYQVATGHLNFYYDLPWYSLKAKVSAGRYLAGDWGSTIDVARVFRNGVVAGAFVTRTDVSAADFGEGSFDKGVYLGIPFDIFFPRSTRREATLIFRPLTRDGGQKVRDGSDLYNATDGAYDNRVLRDWPDVVR